MQVFLVYVIDLTEIRFLAFAYFCFSLCCTDKSTTVRISINGAYKELNFLCPHAFLHTYCTSNAGNFFGFCLQKNIKLQNVTSISLTFGR